MKKSLAKAHSEKQSKVVYLQNSAKKPQKSLKQLRISFNVNGFEMMKVGTNKWS